MSYGETSWGMAHTILVMFIIFVVLGIFGLGLWGCPNYNVWQQGLAGEAELRRAEQNRQIRIEEAQAEKEAATLLKDAEVIRAQGVKEVIETIGEGLSSNEQYLRYLWVQGLHDGSSEIIYIPTEANLPILEATRGTKQRE